MFKTTSYWDQQEFDLPDLPRQPKAATRSVAITSTQLEDWSHRLGPMSDEAHDEHLGALASDLLDLRDEILYELHKDV